MDRLDLNSSTPQAMKDEHGGRYPDLILPRGNMSSEHLSRGEDPSSPVATSSPTTLPLNPPVVTPSNPRRCTYCNESSTRFGKCSCPEGSRGDEGFSSGNSPSREKNSSRDDVTIKMHGESLEFVKPFRDSEKVSLSNNDDTGVKYGRKWEYFPGKNKFYFNGRLMTAPNIRFCMLSFFLILLTFVLFTVFDGPFLAERLSIAIPIIGSVLFFLVIVNMIKTSCSDPGILPRASAQESEFIEKSYANPNGLRPPPRTKDIIVNGQTIKSKYCFTCKMFRPPRASHCGVCDNCVDRFDHHCPFLGNCIGKRNYRNFYTFVVSLSLLAVFVLCCSITKLALLGKERGNFLDALRESPTSAIVILISFFGMWTVIGLAGFHTYLIAVEQTTNEDIKGMFGRVNTINPYTRGNFCQNCCFILCGPYQPSLIDSRGFVTPDFLASLPKKTGAGHDNPVSNQCSLPPPSIRPHCGEGSNTPRSGGIDISGTQTMYQITALESGAHKLESGNATSPTGTGTGNPVGNNTKVFTSANQVTMPASRAIGPQYPKAGTVPESGVLRNADETNSQLTYQYGNPHGNQRQTQNQQQRNYFGSDSYGGMSQNESNSGYNNYNEEFEQEEPENYWAVALEGSGHGQDRGHHSIQKSTSNDYHFGDPSGNPMRDEMEDMSMSMVHLDFPEYISPSSLVRNGKQKEMGLSISTSTSVPLISVNMNPQSKRKKRDFTGDNSGYDGSSVPALTTGLINGHESTSGHVSSTMTNRRRTLPPPTSAADAPVALAFHDDDEDEVDSLENLTMINSPLHLDSIS